MIVYLKAEYRYFKLDLISNTEESIVAMNEDWFSHTKYDYRDMKPVIPEGAIVISKSEYDLVDNKCLMFRLNNKLKEQ